MSNETTPRICPVTGMFLDEPEYEEYFTVESGVAGSAGLYRPISRGNFNTGNCFATREDAERYAKHLKAMAKLRRLGGIERVVRTHGWDASGTLIWMDDKAYAQLTPEEQNALLWPNEEK